MQDAGFGIADEGGTVGQARPGFRRCCAIEMPGQSYGAFVFVTVKPSTCQYTRNATQRRDTHKDKD